MRYLERTNRSTEKVQYQQLMSQKNGRDYQDILIVDEKTPTVNKLMVINKILNSKHKRSMSPKNDEAQVVYSNQREILFKPTTV